MKLKLKLMRCTLCTRHKAWRIIFVINTQNYNPHAVNTQKWGKNVVDLSVDVDESSSLLLFSTKILLQFSFFFLFDLCRLLSTK